MWDLDTRKCDLHIRQYWYGICNINFTDDHWTALYHTCEDNATLYFVDSTMSRAYEAPLHIKKSGHSTGSFEQQTVGLEPY